MDKVAIVNMNSFFKCGVASCILHLAHETNWDVIAVNKDGKPTDADLVSSKVKYITDANIGMLQAYDYVIFGQLARWDEKSYSFLDGLSLKHVSVMIHNRREYDEEMHLDRALAKFPNIKAIIFSDSCKPGVPYLKVKHPFNRRLIPQPIMTHRDHFLFTSRLSPSKSPDRIVQMTGAHPVHIYGTGNSFVDMETFGKSNVKLFESFETDEMAQMYCSAIGLLDGTNYDWHGTSYSIMEAWNYGTIPFCFPNMFCDEVIPNETCMELTAENIDRIANDFDKAFEMSLAGEHVLRKYHTPGKIRKQILEFMETK